jgi:hypothetical protein
MSARLKQLLAAATRRRKRGEGERVKMPFYIVHYSVLTSFLLYIMKK